MWSGSATPGQRTVWRGNSGSSISSILTDRHRNREAAGFADGFYEGGARLSLVRAAPRSAGVLGGPEARATAAGADRIGIVDREAGAHQRVDVVDLGALEQVDALAVDVHGDPVRLEDAVLLGRGILDHHPV